MTDNDIFYREKRLILQEVNIALDDGGLGDNIARLPAINYILKNHPFVKIYLYVPSYFKGLAERSLPKSRMLEIYTFDYALNAKKMIPLLSFEKTSIKNLSQHLTEHAFNVLCNRLPINTNDYNYLPVNTKGTSITRFNLPEKYIVMTSAFTTAVREFSAIHINEINNYIINSGYSVVFLGKTETSGGLGFKINGNFSDDIDFSVGVDLRDKTNLLECVSILEKSKAVLGLDNGLLHLAATTSVPIIGGFTTVHPEQRMPYRNGIKGFNYSPVTITNSELPCIHCQSNMTFIFNHNFSTCYYGDRKCVELLTAEKYIAALKQVLDI